MYIMHFLKHKSTVFQSRKCFWAFQRNRIKAKFILFKNSIEMNMKKCFSPRKKIKKIAENRKIHGQKKCIWQMKQKNLASSV